MYPLPGFDNEPHTTPVLHISNHFFRLYISITPTYTLLVQAPVSLLTPSILFFTQKPVIFWKHKSDYIPQPVPLMSPQMWPKRLQWAQAGTILDTII